LSAGCIKARDFARRGHRGWLIEECAAPVLNTEQRPDEKPPVDPSLKVIVEQPPQCEALGDTQLPLQASSPEVQARLVRNEPVDPGEYYFRTAPVFETGDARYGWLNNIVAVGVGVGRGHSITIRVELPENVSLGSLPRRVALTR
jgi:hypothetical protein